MASPLFKFAPSEFSRQKSPKPFALPCMDAQMPRRQDGEERPGHHPSDPLRSSTKPAQKELVSFAVSNTFLLIPALSAVLGGAQSQWADFSNFHSPPLWAIIRCEGTAPTEGPSQTLLTRRASQSLTGGKRGVFERSELASACQGREAQNSRRPR
jgi:hypothetical protein